MLSLIMAMVVAWMSLLPDVRRPSVAYIRQLTSYKAAHNCTSSHGF